MGTQKKTLFISDTVKYAAMIAGLIHSPALLAQTDQSASVSPEGVEDIVVTAQKREQNMQSVPIAVTAITGATLQAARFQNLLNLSAIAPGFAVRPSAGGVQGVAPSMRGIYGLSTIGQDQGVAFYIDGVYVNGLQGSAFDLANVERIEVLRGPQGTLFGRNSLGGAINIITRDPTGEFSARQELTYGNYDSFRSKTHVELPALGPLAASLTYLHNERRGDIRNYGAGTVWDYGPSTNGRYGKLSSPKYLGDQNVEAISAAVKLTASPDLKFIYKFNWTENRYTPNGAAVGGIDANNPTGKTVLGILAAQPNPAILTPITRSRPDAVNNDFAQRGFLRTVDHNLTVTWRASDQISFKNTLAYRKRLLISSDQVAGLGGLVSGGSPFVVVVANTEGRDKQWSNEFQANFNTEGFDLTAGYLHYWDKGFGGNKPGSPASLSFRNIPNYEIPTTGIQPSDVTTVSDAIYAQAEVKLTEQLGVTVGGRWTWDRKTGTDRTFPGVIQPINYRENKPTYLAGINYTPMDRFLAYFKFSTGYISGGQLSSLKYTSSTARSFEGGIKADWLDNKLRTNLALFHVDYSKIQFVVAGALLGIPAGQAIVNGGDARVQGAELEVTLVPTAGLTLTGNMSYLDFKYKKVNPALGQLGTFVPIFVPNWTGALSAQYETAELVGGGRLQLRADALYTGKQYIGQPRPGQAPGYFESSIAPQAWLLNTRVALAGYEIGGTKAEIALWVRNLTNNRSRISGADYGFLNLALYQPARTYGVDFNLSF